MAAVPSPVEWDMWACLAMVSAAVLGAINFVVGYRTAAGWKSFRQTAWQVRTNLFGLLLLEALTGFAATWIVVGLGLTKPDWLDDPLGWLVLGSVGPALAGASIATFKVGEARVDLGVATIYKPLRRILLQDVRLEFTVAKLRYETETEALYRQRVLQAYHAGDRQLPDRIAEVLGEYKETDVVSNEEKVAVDALLKLTSQPGTSAEDQLGQMVAFLVRRGWVRILDGIVGEPSKADRRGVSAEAPPESAAMPSDDSESGPNRD